MGILAWQGWQLDVPARWNPVRIEGDWKQGYVLLADLHRPRLGIRWSTPENLRTFDPAQWSKRAMRQEVGQLAADEAREHPMADDRCWRASMLYVEPKPPGRDVWLAYSTPSRRAIEIVYHAHRRDRALVETVLPGLRDMPENCNPMPWAIFDLTCRVPAEYLLARHQLSAGDLQLCFAATRGRRGGTLDVRQIAPATLALSRQPLQRWLEQHQQAVRKHFRPRGAFVETALSERITGVKRQLRRRRRWFWIKRLPPQMCSVALHDVERDRIIIVQGDGEDLCREVAQSVGSEVAARKMANVN